MDPRDEKILQRFRELEQLLQDPSATKQPERLKALGQEYRQIAGLARRVAELQRVERLIEEADLTLASGDVELAGLAVSERDDLIHEHAKLTRLLDVHRVADDPLASRNLIMEIRAGTGGGEAALFAADLYRLYLRYAERQGWPVSLLSSSRTDLGGYKEIIYKITGPGAYGQLRYESGTHRVQRIPQTEKSGRVHTSTVTVAVLPEAQEVDLTIRPEELNIDVFRAGGHGGQSVNTTDSAVRITHLPTGLVVQCQDERSQLQNKIKAMTVLRSRLYAAQQEKIARERGQLRKLQIGAGVRAEKIRTYNFPQDRLTDHRLKANWHNLAAIMDGEISPIIASLQRYSADAPDAN